MDSTNMEWVKIPVGHWLSGPQSFLTPGQRDTLLRLTLIASLPNGRYGYVELSPRQGMPTRLLAAHLYMDVLSLGLHLDALRQGGLIQYEAGGSPIRIVDWDKVQSKRYSSSAETAEGDSCSDDTSEQEQLDKGRRAGLAASRIRRSHPREFRREALASLTADGCRVTSADGELLH